MNAIAVTLAVLGTLTLLRSQDFDVAAIQLPKGEVLTGALAADFDGDGQRDLILACRRDDARQRSLRFHRRSADGPRFTNVSALPPLAVDDDVIAFAAADLRPTPGEELVLLTAERAVLAMPGDEPRYESLASIALVWPAAEREFVLPLRHASVDLDGDGSAELLLPEADGALWLRGERSARLRLPPFASPFAAVGNGAASLRGDGNRLRLQLGGEPDDESDDDEPLVRIARRAPPVYVADLDGDGKLELFALRNDQLFIATPEALATPRVRTLPLPPDRLRPLDPDFDVQLVELDGDSLPDLLLTTSARRGDEIEVRIDVFRTRADGTWAEKPDGRLRLSTLAMPPQLVDVDGDGRRDLIALTMRTDLLRGLTGGAPTALEAQLVVFRNAGGRFAMPAALNSVLRLPVEIGAGDAFAKVLPPNGGEALLLVHADGQLQRRPFVRDGERLRLGDPDRRLPIGKDGKLHFDELTGDVQVQSRSELLHVRVR
jgi:hypothetical protein